jgi:hypothetical protein
VNALLRWPVSLPSCPDSEERTGIRFEKEKLWGERRRSGIIVAG